MSALRAPIFATSQGELTAQVAGALQQSHGHLRGALHIVADKMGSNADTAKNVWRGRNAPNLLHFLRLLATTPELWELVHELCDAPETPDHAALRGEMRRLAVMEAEHDPDFEREFNKLIIAAGRLAVQR